jgi:hypothetical protein
MRFSDYVAAAENLSWPSIDADGLAKEALGRLTSGNGTIDDMATLQWYVFQCARVEGIALSSVADRSLVMLSKLPQAKNFGP